MLPGAKLNTGTFFGFQATVVCKRSKLDSILFPKILFKPRRNSLAATLDQLAVINMPTCSAFGNNNQFLS